MANWCTPDPEVASTASEAVTKNLDTMLLGESRNHEPIHLLLSSKPGQIYLAVSIDFAGNVGLTTDSCLCVKNLKLGGQAMSLGIQKGWKIVSIGTELIDSTTKLCQTVKDCRLGSIFDGTIFVVVLFPPRI